MLVTWQRPLMLYTPKKTSETHRENISQDTPDISIY